MHVCPASTSQPVSSHSIGQFTQYRSVHTVWVSSWSNAGATHFMVSTSQACSQCMQGFIVTAYSSPNPITTLLTPKFHMNQNYGNLFMITPKLRGHSLS